MKLGSLFDGSGGFPLSGYLMGIEPVWAAEVEPYPIAVTKSRFPKMKHLGSVTDVHGGKIEPVDIITFGSPCQDLSVVGKRAGLKHEDEGDEETTRSGLFVEAVRIIKEMRDATNGVYPRFAVWENVPGAFSSNRGEDFRTVLEKLIQIAEPSAVMPGVPKAGWAYADYYRGHGWSIAYRTFDAQYWGVPQRRRRIYLVADFRGECAGEILFKSNGLRGYFEEGRAPWQGVAKDAERGVGADDTENGISYTMVVRSGCDVDSKGKAAGKGALVQTERASTLSTVQDQYLFQPITFEPGIAQREGGHIYEGVSGTLRAKMGDNQMAVAYPGVGITSPTNASNPQPGDPCHTLSTDSRNYVVVGFDAYNQAVTGDVSMAMTARSSDAHHVPVVITDKPIGFDDYNFEVTGDKTCTLRAGASGGACGVSVGQPVYAVENHPADSRVNLDESGKVQTLTSRMGTGGGNVPLVMEKKIINLNNGDVQSKTICDPNGIAPALYAGECRGGGGELYVMDAIGLDRASFNQGKNAQFDFSVTEDGTEPTLTARGPGAVCYCLQDKSIGRKESNSCHGLGVSEETSYALTGVDRHAVVYSIDQGGGKSSCCVTEGTAPTLTATHDGSPAVAYGFDPGASRDVGDIWLEEQSKTLTNGTCPGHHNGVVCTDVGWLNSEDEQSPTLLARMHKDPHLVSYWDGGQTVGTLTANNAGGNQRMPDKENFNAVIESRPHRYIVRRLTPTECARLQGFPDKWGHPDIKEKFTKEEYEFWLDIRNTHAIINGKSTKQYTKDQMLNWYNKLHTDAAEYKMWGNGIALPTALYVLQGITEAVYGVI